MAALSKKGIETISLEVTDEQSINSCLDHVRTATEGRGLDMLINNAGINYTVPALDVDMGDIRRLFETNVFAVMALCQKFAPLLIEAKGTIVMIGSLAGVIPYVFGSGYGKSHTLPRIAAGARILQAKLKTPDLVHSFPRP